MGPKLYWLERGEEMKEKRWKKKIGVSQSRENSLAFSSWIAMKIDKGSFSEEEIACFKWMGTLKNSLMELRPKLLHWENYYGVKYELLDQVPKALFF